MSFPTSPGQTIAIVGQTGSGKSSIIIAHRLSTVRAVDRIVVLDHGTIIEQGNHASLMARGGHYAELYDTYFRHPSPEYRPATPVVA